MPSSHDSPHLRATPVQTRSAKTLDVILAASARLLVDQGLPGFNTNAVAKSAGINVATLYHYFPNKTAILRELFERYETQRLEYTRSRLDDLVATDDLEEWLRDTYASLLKLRSGQTGVVALRRACRAVPELMEADEAANRASANDLGGALQRRMPLLPAARASVAARSIVEVTATLLDFAGDRPESAASVIEELKTLILGYLTQLASAPA